MTDAAPETEAPETSGREVDVIPEGGSDLVLYVNEHPAIVLLDEGRRDKFFEAIKAEVSSHVPDVATAKGRAAIRSLAMKVTKTKTAIDNAGKKLKEDAQKTVQTVDAARRASKQLLEPLAVEVRAPLTDWDTREELRIEKAEGIMTGLREDAIIKTTDTAEEIAARLERIEGAELDPEVLKDRVEGAEELKAAALVALREGLARLQREEADRAELEALRAEKEKAEKEKAARLAAYEAAKAEQRRAAEVARRSAPPARPARPPRKTSARVTRRPGSNGKLNRERTENDRRNRDGRGPEAEPPRFGEGPDLPEGSGGRRRALRG